MAIINLKQTGLIIGIAILLAFFVYFTIEALYPSPKYEDFCKNFNYRETPVAKVNGAVNCTDVWQTKAVQECSSDKGSPEFKQDVNGCDVFDNCNYCSRDFDRYNNKYQRNVFIITALIGIISIIFGMYFGVEFVAGGFLFGGIITLAYSTIRYFSRGNVDNWLRVIVLFIEILILIWIGYKKVVNKDKVKKR